MQQDNRVRSEISALGGSSPAPQLAAFLQAGVSLQSAEEHMTASVLVVDAVSRAILLVLHPTLKMWIRPGVHVDPNELPWDAALRELEEETTLQAAFSGDPRTHFVDADTHTVAEPDGRKHVHHDLCFALEVDMRAAAATPADGVSGVAWVLPESLDELVVAENVRRTAKEWLAKSKA